MIVVGSQISWDRGDLPRGVAKVVEVKEHNERRLYMARDKNNNLFGLPEHVVTEEV